MTRFRTHRCALAALTLALAVVTTARPAAAQPDMIAADPAPADPAPADPAPATTLTDADAEPVAPVGPNTFEGLQRRAGDPPIGIPDFYLVEQDVALTVPAERGVKANDAEPEGESFFLSSFFPPPNGTLSLTTAGNFTYTPAPGYAGVDSFRYVLSDGDVTSDPVTVRFDVLPSFGRAPDAVADRYSVAAGDTLLVEAPGILANDYDPDGTALTALSFVQGDDGEVDLNTAGRFQYVPDPGFSGEESITYSIRDADGDTDFGSVTIFVYDANRAPVAAKDVYYTPAGTTLSIDAPGLLVNDIDPDGDALTVQSFTAPPSGTMSVLTNGSFVYTPPAGFVGEVDLGYSIVDGNGGSALGDLTLIVGVFGDIATGVITPSAPGGFALEAPAPNPFNPTTTLAFRLETAGRAQLTIYDVRGRFVRELVDDDRPAGEFRATWDGRDASGRPVASGSYVAELRSGDQRAVRKLQLVK